MGLFSNISTITILRLWIICIFVHLLVKITPLDPLSQGFLGPAAYMLPRSSVSKPMTPAYTMRPKPNVGSFTEDLAKVNWNLNVWHTFCHTPEACDVWTDICCTWKLTAIIFNSDTWTRNIQSDRTLDIQKQTASIFDDR